MLKQEIAERKRVEEALRESEKRFRDFLDNLGDIAYETNHSGNITYVNKMAQTVTDIPLTEMVGESFSRSWHKKAKKWSGRSTNKHSTGKAPNTN